MMVYPLDCIFKLCTKSEVLTYTQSKCRERENGNINDGHMIMTTVETMILTQ